MEKERKLKKEKENLGGTKDARDDDDARDTVKQGGDGGDVGGEGGDDYVGSKGSGVDDDSGAKGGGDGVAVVHGVRMVSFHLNVPALIEWEKGAVVDAPKHFLEKMVQAMEPWLGKKKKSSSSVVDKGSSATGKVLDSKKECSIGGTKDLPSLSQGDAIPLLDDPEIQRLFCLIANDDCADVSRDLLNNNVATATERKEKVDDDEEKEVKLLICIQVTMGETDISASMVNISGAIYGASTGKMSSPRMLMWIVVSSPSSIED